MDCFFCSCANDPLRGAIATACLQRWIMESQAHDIHCVTSRDAAFAQKFEPCHMTESIAKFMTMHRYVAEQEAESSIYCVTDDDIQPIGNNFLTKARAILEQHPDFGLIAFSSCFVLEVKAPHGSFEDADVAEVASPGGLYVIRRGILEVDTSDPFWDDTKTGDQMRQKGYKTGYFKRLKCNHYGAYLSTCWPARTGATQIMDVYTQ
jgi:hypothetical protein